MAREGSLNWTDNFPITIAESATVSLKSKELLIPQRKQRWELILWTVGMSILGALLFFFAAKKQAARPVSVATGEAAHLTIPSLEGSTISNPKHAINLRISVSPASAKILIDGREVAGNPVSLSVPSDGSAHGVLIQASDFKSRTLNIVFDRDQDVVVALESNVPAMTPSSRPSHQLQPNSASVTGGLQPANKDCEPPYFVDERGIKHFKPGCI